MYNLTNSNNLNDFIDEFFGGFKTTCFTNWDDVNKKEKEDGYELSFALPGFKKDDIDISLDGNILNLKNKKDSKGFYNNGFTKNYQIPADADINNITASMNEGVLTVTLPKSEDNKRKIEII